MIANIKIELPFLRPFIFASTTSTSFPDEADLLCTSQPRAFFIVSEDCLDFAANCSLAMISTEPMIWGRMKSLRPWGYKLDANASVERNKRKVKQRGSGFKEVRVKELGKNLSKGAEINAA